MVRLSTLALINIFSRSTLAALQFKSPNGTSVANYGSFFDITWDKDNTSPISIWLYQGYDAGIKQIDTITSNTQNDNLYSWAVVGGGNYFASGCDYALLMTDGSTRVWSTYFTINDEHDGGLPPDSNCTTLAKSPKSPTVPASAASSGSSKSTTRSATTATRTSTSTDSPTSESGTSDSGNSTNSAKNGSGIRLGVIIAIVVVGMFVLFAGILILLRCRGYLRKQKPSPVVAIAPHDQTYQSIGYSNGASGIPRSADGLDKPQQYSPAVASAYPTYEPQMLDGRPSIVQLPGSERER